MSYWSFSDDSDQTCFDHLSKHTPDSIKDEARRELQDRGYSDSEILERED